MRVLVCDRVSIVRHGLLALLEQEADIEMIEATGSGIDAIILTRRHHPHVVVTGLKLDGISGLELVRRLNQEELEPQPHFVVLSVLEDEDTISTVLRSGVNGILAEDVTGEQLGSAVRAAANGEMMLAPQVATRLVNWFLRQVPQTDAPLRSMAESLTVREREVLRLLARGMSVEDVATELFIGTTTVRTHIYRLRNKVHLKDRAQLVSFAYQSGLMQNGDAAGLAADFCAMTTNRPAERSSARSTVSHRTGHRSSTPTLQPVTSIA